MRVPTWHLFAFTLLHELQSHDPHDQQVIDGFTEKILTQQYLGFTAQETYKLIGRALKSEEPLNDPTLHQRHPEHVSRDFLLRLRQRMDDLRPWPELPYLKVQTWPYSRIKRARPVARIPLDYLLVQERLLRSFDHMYMNSRKHMILCLSLPSGSQVALVTCREEGEHDEDVTVLVRRRTHAAEVLAELQAVTGLEVEPTA
ncbi:hypothetical protein ACSNOI_06280 [Actinomadura kijaniata]|uniref:hypothetical protein n=1 Tax=Actinomadura kijaniata TaxID=46161 RepID=UPI003F1A0E75